MTSSGSPVFLEMDRAFYFTLRRVGLEAAALENVDHPRGLREDALPAFAIFSRDANHLWVATQIHMGPRRVKRLAQAFLQLAAGNEILNVDLVLHRVGLARRQAQKRIAGITAHQ